MRVLIIGGTALIGPHVIRELSQEHSCDVHTFNRSGKRYLCESNHAGDRRDPVAMERLIGNVQPDVVVNMISFTTEDAELLVTALSNLRLTVPVMSAEFLCIH